MTRCLLAKGWHDSHIAGFIRSKFEDPASHWKVASVQAGKVLGCIILRRPKESPSPPLAGRCQQDREASPLTPDQDEITGISPSPNDPMPS